MTRRQVSFVDDSSLTRAMAEFGVEVVPKLGMAIHEEMQLVFERSQEIVPFQDGVLAGSGMLFPLTAVSDGAIVEIGYGGAASAYAEVQHENTEFRHDPGRQAKYLEEPFYDALPDIEERIATRLRSIMDG